MNKDKVNAWVEQKLISHKMSQRELAGEIGRDNSYLSKVLSGKKTASFDFYLEIARYFNAVPELLREAGLLPDLDEEGVTFAEIFNVIKQLSPEEQKEVLNYSDYLLKKQKGQPTHDEQNDEGNVIGNHSATTV